MYNNYLSSSKHPLNHHITTTKPLLTTTVTESQSPMTSLIKSSLNGSKLRYVILIVFSPLIIPIVFVTFPFICAAEVCWRRRRRGKVEVAPEMMAAQVVVTKKEGEGGGDVAVSLLERYLEDQLGLAIEILDECGGDLGGGGFYGYSSLDDHSFDFDFDTRANNSLC